MGLNPGANLDPKCHVLRLQASLWRGCQSSWPRQGNPLTRAELCIGHLADFFPENFFDGLFQLSVLHMLSMFPCMTINLYLKLIHKFPHILQVALQVMIPRIQYSWHLLSGPWQVAPHIYIYHSTTNRSRVPSVHHWIVNYRLRDPTSISSICRLKIQCQLFVSYPYRPYR